MKKIVKADFNVPPKIKEWFQSKTLWINVLALISGVMLGIMGNLEAGIPLTGMAVIGIIMRCITKLPITTPLLE